MGHHMAMQIKLGDKLVEVDEKILPLVTALWDLGMETTLSCQSQRGRVWICFENADSAKKFMELICRDSMGLRHFVRSSSTREYDHHPNRWKVKGRWWVDAATQGARDKKDRPVNKMHLWISIRFPKIQLEEVTSIVVRERDKRQAKIKKK